MEQPPLVCLDDPEVNRHAEAIQAAAQALNDALSSAKAAGLRASFYTRESDNFPQGDIAKVVVSRLALCERLVEPEK